MLSTRPNSRHKAWATSRAGAGRGAVIVHFADAGPDESLTIAYTPTAFTAADVANVLDALYGAVSACYAAAAEATAASDAEEMEDIEQRLISVIEEAERHINRYRKDIDPVDAGAVHRIFHELVRALRTSRAILVNCRVEQRSVPYVGLIRIRQHLSEVLRTVHRVARAAHLTGPSAG